MVGLVDPDPVKKEAARRLLPEAWRDFSNGDLFETVIALASGLTLDPARSAKSAQGRGKTAEHFEALTPELLAISGRAIIGGQKGAAALCERYRADMEKRRQYYGRRKELGALAYATYDKHIEPKIRSLLGGIINASMQTTSRNDYLVRKDADADPSMMTIEGLSKTFGIRRFVVQRLSKSGLIPVVRGNVRSPVRMAVADVLPLLADMKDALSELATAGRLGLSVTMLPSLVDRGLIRRLQGPVCGLVPGYRGYTKSSVDELMDKIWSKARPAGDKCRSIAFAARSMGPGERPGPPSSRPSSPACPST